MYNKNMVWQLQEAKNKLSEVVDKSITDGPQTITRRGVDAVVVLSVDEYRKLLQPKQGLKELLLKSHFVDLNIERDRSVGGRGTETDFETLFT